MQDIWNDYESAEIHGEIGLEDFLFSPKLQNINNILIHLQETGKDGYWLHCTEEDLFPNILMNKDVLMMFIKLDLDIISYNIERFTVSKIFASKNTKDVTAAKIAFLFGSGQLIYKMEKKVPLVKNFAQNIVETFPLIILQSVHAGIVHVKTKGSGKQN